jgi:Glycosyl hydrolase catalytic core
LVPVTRRVKVNELSIEKMRQSAAKSRCAAGFVVALAAVLSLLVPVPAHAVSREFFGIVPAQSPGSSEFQTMGEARVGTYRFQLNWAHIQPAEGGPYDWSATDEEVRGAARNGIQPLPFVFGTPGYAAGSHVEPPLGSTQSKEAWQRFLSEAVARYGPGGSFWEEFAISDPGVEPQPITAWQIWNEQNSPTFFQPKPSPGKYAELLRLSDDAITTADPNAEILLGGMFGTPSRNRGIFSWRFLKRLYRVNGAKSHFDAVALHPYSPNLAGIKAQIELARKQMKKGGDRGTPIWITEIGWGSGGTAGSDLIKSRAGQKKMLRRSFNLILARRGKWNISRLLWFAWRDPDVPEDSTGLVCSWCSTAGLLDRLLETKPSFDQFRRFTGAG